MPELSVNAAIEAVFRREAGRVLATLIRLLGDFDLAEEARQDAFEAALEQWPASGIPANPSAWLVGVGRNKAIDQVRRDAVYRHKVQHLEAVEAELSLAAGDDESDEPLADDPLRLIFTCCHPALGMEARIALTLREVCGLTTPAVARAFLVSEETMAQRLVRAKKKIRDAGIPYETPEPSMLEERVDGVLAVIYLVFTEGYAMTAGEELIRSEICREAIRLGRLLDAWLPERGPVLGLLALMLLHDARRSARVSPAGDVVLLDDQDRRLWDQNQIAEGLLLVERSLRSRGRVSAYAVQAAIAALHSRASAAEPTDWPQIVGLYELLLRLQPTPVVELNHAVAVSMVDGPSRALALVDSLSARGGIGDYHLLYAVRADLLRRLGRIPEAREACVSALASARLEPERRLLAKRLAEIDLQAG
ncbi:MAG: polymerase subunit sigma-24 [Hydrocarboniphaga sp.]|uniref:RNA polymerase sigma factor n=1 Tax=Hydrocarboniphaga sp. TaxID=2033016 RepID=UPI0026184823|nr:RNA polymerase sigma factor [Hydrocarboniphaga sp.]MDB5971189.1 polymerase subunit sigma-24 [Hydrocarboniphaga sp.]